MLLCVLVFLLFVYLQTCVLKVNIHCDGCKQKVKKLLQRIEGAPFFVFRFSFFVFFNLLNYLICYVSSCW